jgi:hypothetical protein
MNMISPFDADVRTAACPHMRRPKDDVDFEGGDMPRWIGLVKPNSEVGGLR